MKTRWLSALALFAAFAQPAQALELDALMGLLGQRKSGEARFVEERIVVGLDGPLRSSGTLSFAAPDRFARRTEAPRAESMEVEGNQVTLKRGGRTRHLTLDAVPELSALADALRGTLAGDARILQRSFRIRVSGTRERWVLGLVPSDDALARQVREIEIAGRGPDVLAIELWMNGGDRSIMHVEPLAAVSASAGAAAASMPSR
jgi:hypothetical protein